MFLQRMALKILIYFLVDWLLSRLWVFANHSDAHINSSIDRALKFPAWEARWTPTCSSHLWVEQSATKAKVQSGRPIRTPQAHLTLTTPCGQLPVGSCRLGYGLWKSALMSVWLSGWSSALSSFFSVSSLPNWVVPQCLIVIFALTSVLAMFTYVWSAIS